MILFTCLTFILLVAALIAVGLIVIGGAAFVVVFGDVIVCILLIYWIICRFRKRKGR